QGLLETEPLQGRDEDAVARADFSSMLSEEEKEELKAELVQLEDEITTLRQVLSAKERHLVEIKQKLGMNLMNELKQNFSKSWHDMQTTSAYKKTQETLSQAGQKATAAFSNVGTAISKKFGDMRYSIRHSISMPAMRNSPTFKSFEERVETTVTSLKVQMKYILCVLVISSGQLSHCCHWSQREGRATSQEGRCAQTDLFFLGTSISKTSFDQCSCLLRVVYRN
uniref:Tumor protein D52-like 1 n=1 Tax=Jaculus jaculus TaxID=51337 RepID=A0A8C5LGS9_JACJA